MPELVILVTGANQGLGKAIIEVGAKRDASSIWILASRDLQKGQEAAEQLRKEAGISAKIDVVQLDVEKDSQIEAAADYVNKTYGKLDVLINNAGQLVRTQGDSLTALRHAYDKVLSVNLTSVAIVTEAFTSLLHKAAHPKVINITSGLGSIHNTLTKKMGRFPPYGSAKIGMNGMTAHQQTAEKDRIEAEASGAKPDSGQSFIKWYIVNPGILKTAFNGFTEKGRDPREGAEPAVRLLFDTKDEYDYATNWEWVDEQMRKVPW